jgi:hypothetical protein
MILLAHHLLLVVLLFRLSTTKSSSVCLDCLVASCLFTLPVIIVGNSSNAAVFGVDIAMVCLGVRVFVTKKRADRKLLDAYPGEMLLRTFAILAFVSALYNFFVIQSEPWRFYLFTAVKLAQFAFLPFLIRETFRRLGFEPCGWKYFSITASFFLVLHLIHLAGVADLTGREFMGDRVAEMEQLNVGLFDSRENYFLAGIKSSVAGCESMFVFLGVFVGAWLSRWHWALAPTFAAISATAVFGTTSRSDIAGTIAGIVVMILIVPSRIRAMLGSGIAMAAVVGATFFISVWVVEGQSTSISRLQELTDEDKLMTGSYLDRSLDRVSLPEYYATLPQELVWGAGPGNFRRFQFNGITRNAMGHNSYLHWLGELGIIGAIVIFAWCGSLLFFVLRRTILTGSAQIRMTLGALGGVLVSRMVAGWGAESLFGTDAMGVHSCMFVLSVYVLVAQVMYVWHERAAKGFSKNELMLEVVMAIK